MLFLKLALNDNLYLYFKNLILIILICINKELKYNSIIY